jgi:hypothetical protein
MTTRERVRRAAKALRVAERDPIPPAAVYAARRELSEIANTGTPSQRLEAAAVLLTDGTEIQRNASRRPRDPMLVSARDVDAALLAELAPMPDVPAIPA